MRTRDTAFLLAFLGLLAALWLVVWDPGGRPTGDSAPGIPRASTAPEAPPDSPPDPPARLVSPEVTPLTAPAAPPREPASGRTSGAIRGHISLSANVVGELRAVHVRIREAVNEIAGGGNDTPPFTQTIKEEIVPELGTPEFHYDGIPFSEYGYVVRVFAPGFNGSQQFVQLDESRPIADVALSVTAGVTFTVLLRDQKRAPVGRERVFLVPVGEPSGRPTLQVESDGYGAAVFASVLEGKYDVRVGAVNAPHNEPTEITVIAVGGERSATVEVPHGFDLGVLVQTIHGWGVENAKLMMYEVDTSKFFKYEGQTDYSGKHVFSHMSPGSYQLNVTAEGYEHWSRVVKVPEDQAPQETIVRLIPR